MLGTELAVALVGEIDEHLTGQNAESQEWVRLVVAGEPRKALRVEAVDDRALGGEVRG